MTTSSSELAAAVDALPSILKPAERFTWPSRQQSLRDSMRDGNAAAFTRWPISQECLFTGDTPETQAELSYILSYPGVNVIAKDSGVGAPSRMAGTRWTSGTYVQQCYYAIRLQKTLGIKLSDVGSILEIGGGYGVMPIVAGRMGFKGSYTILDLPELTILQSWYLKQHSVSNVSLVERIDGVARPDLLIACCSLSEIPVEMRLAILSSIQASMAFFVYQFQYLDVNNDAWFTNYANGIWPNVSKFVPPFNTNHCHLSAK
jgi:hypothetical protein